MKNFWKVSTFIVGGVAAFLGYVVLKQDRDYKTLEMVADFGVDANKVLYEHQRRQLNNLIEELEKTRGEIID